MVAGETALASDVNENFEDLGDEITNSVAVDGQSTLTGQFKAANGSVSAPGITFGADTDSGIYRIGANDLGMGVNGALVQEWTTAGILITGTITPSGQIVGAVGSVSAPGYSFAGDLNTGWYWIGADNAGMAVGGTKILDVASTGLSVTGTITPSGQIVGAAGSVSAPGYSFASDLNAGFYRIGADNVGLTLNGSKVVDWATTGETITGTITVSGAATLQSTVAVTGASTLTGAVTANNSAGVTAYNTCKAFAVFTVSGTTVSFTAGNYFNVASVTRTAEGIFDILFTNALPTANYVVLAIGQRETNGTDEQGNATSKATTGFTLTFVAEGGSNGDCDPGEFVVFGF